MEKLVNEIVDLHKPENETSRNIYYGGIGLILSIILPAFACVVLWTAVKIAGVPGISQTCFEIVLITCIYLGLVIVLISCFYFVKYATCFLVVIFRYGMSPVSNKKNSIEALMTSEVIEKERMHQAIIGYLKDNPEAKCFAALYIWLNENKLIKNTKQVDFLSALSIDATKKGTNGHQGEKAFTVPAKSSFNDWKNKLEETNKKQYNDSSFPQEFVNLFSPFLKNSQ